MSNPVPGLRRPADLVGGIVYFGRMVDKIRLHQAGTLPAEYHENLGEGFDERCTHFLHLSYQALVDHLKASPHVSDEQLLEWSFNQGRQPDEDEIEIWNAFMSKRGWKDAASERLAQRKADAGVAHRADIETFFQFIDADEGRKE